MQIAHLRLLPSAKTTTGKGISKSYADPNYDPTKKYHCENHGGDRAHHNTADCKLKGKLDPVKAQLKTFTTALQSIMAPAATPPLTPAPETSFIASFIDALKTNKEEAPKTFNAVKHEYPAKIPCDHCKKPTHKSEVCRLNPDPTSPNYGLTFEQMQAKTKCRNCGELGHFSSKCTKEKKAASTTTP